MLGYGEYWNCGWDVSQWKAVFNPLSYNWVDFTFISLWMDYDRKMRSYTAEAYLLGLRLWINFGWEGPTDEIMEAIKEVAGEIAKKEESRSAPSPLPPD